MKKRKGLIIAAIIVAVLLAGTAATYLFARDTIQNTIALMTKSDIEYFRWVSDKQVTATSNKLSLATSIGEMAGKLFPEENGTRGTADVQELSATAILDVSGKLSDMLDLVHFRRDEIDVTVLNGDGNLALEIVPKYGDLKLLTVKGFVNQNSKTIYAQVPEYREDLVDITDLAASKIFGKTTVQDVIGEVDHAGGKSGKLNIAAAYKRYMTFLAESFDEAAVEKKFEAEVDGAKKKFTRVTVKTTSAKLNGQIYGLAEMLAEDGIIGNAGIFTDAWDMLMNLVGSEAKGECDIYVDRKGNICGGELRCTVQATKVAITFFGTDDGADAGISVNSLPAATVKVTNSLEKASLCSTIDLQPETFVKALLGDAGDLSAKIDASFSDKAGSLTVLAIQDNNTVGQAKLSYDLKDYSGDFPKTDDLKVYAFDTLLQSKYFDAPALAEVALGILDEVNEGFVNDYIDSVLGSFLGDVASIDALRMLYNTGMLSMFSGTGPAIGEEPEPEPEPTIPGIECLAPEDYVPTEWKYPAADEVFRYSHEYLSGCATINQYKKIEYTVPVSDEITEDRIEERKQKLLAKYVGVFNEDETQIAVQDGDEVYFDIVPLLGGYPVTMYAYNDCYELMGTDQYGEGLDAKIIGMHVGEVRDIEATLGDQFEDFAGYTGIFRVTLKSIVRETVPSWTEEFICGRLKYDSLEACRQSILDQLIAEVDVSEEAVRNAVVNIVWDSATQNTVPEKLMNQIRQERYNTIYDYTIGLGLSPIQFCISEGGTLEQLQAEIDDSIAIDLSRYCFYATIAKGEGITATGKEVGEAIENHMNFYNCSTFDELMQSITLDEIVDEVIEGKVDQLIYDSAIVTYR